MQVHALHQALALHAQQRGARGVEREALLLHGAQVARADAVALSVRSLEQPQPFADRRTLRANSLPPRLSIDRSHTTRIVIRAKAGIHARF